MISSQEQTIPTLLAIKSRALVELLKTEEVGANAVILVMSLKHCREVLPLFFDGFVPELFAPSRHFQKAPPQPLRHRLALDREPAFSIFRGVESKTQEVEGVGLAPFPAACFLLKPAESHQPGFERMEL